MSSGVRTGVIAVCALVVGACHPTQEGPIPDAEQVVGSYQYSRGLEAEVRGNVATVFVEQDPQQLRRGGSLWAKVGPYIFLFSEETRQLLEEYTGLAAVRVVTRVGEAEVARALLVRDELSDILWTRSVNLAAHARRDGTSRITLLEDLVEWGEDHTDFEYNERYTRR